MLDQSLTSIFLPYKQIQKNRCSGFKQRLSTLVLSLTEISDVGSNSWKKGSSPYLRRTLYLHFYTYYLYQHKQTIYYKTILCITFRIIQGHHGNQYIYVPLRSYTCIHVQRVYMYRVYACLPKCRLQWVNYPKTSRALLCSTNYTW